jgi:formamidopyrimidine-DNA glycosylase
MPELPEVENVKLSLEGLGLAGQTFAAVELKRPDLRVAMPKTLGARLKGQTLTGISRRAKFILFETENHALISHLGMTGSWRELTLPRKHDHVILHFASGLRLAFNDPRRFGVWISPPKPIWNGTAG